MTFTFNDTTMYIVVTLVLTGIQIYQHFLITNLQKEVKRLWEQAATSAIILFGKVEELDKKVNNK